jgi:hypothetical protein
MRYMSIDTLTRRAVLGALAATLLFVLASPTTAAVTPEQKCEAGKNLAAGKYAACRQKAEGKLVSKGDATAYGFAISKCETKLAEGWAKLEAAAASKGASCPDAPLVEGDFKAVVDAHSANIKTGLAGSGLVWSGNGANVNPRRSPPMHRVLDRGPYGKEEYPSLCA